MQCITKYHIERKQIADVTPRLTVLQQYLEIIGIINFDTKKENKAEEKEQILLRDQTRWRHVINFFIFVSRFHLSQPSGRLQSLLVLLRGSSAWTPIFLRWKGPQDLHQMPNATTSPYLPPLGFVVRLPRRSQ